LELNSYQKKGGGTNRLSFIIAFFLALVFNTNLHGQVYTTTGSGPWSWNDSTGVFSFIREVDNQKIIATFNSSVQEQSFPKQILLNCSDNWKLISGSVENGKLKTKSYALFVRNQ